MRVIASEILAGAMLLGQAPTHDIRNTYTPNTDTHFTMPEYKTLAEWEARKAHLGKQILSAAGLLAALAELVSRPR